MAGLRPDRVGSPLSIQSLREDIEVSHDTIKRWLSYLESLYYQFTIRPYSKRLTRALKKEPKIYLYDWSEIDHAGPRFENLVASHLLKACDFWTDSGHGPWNLTYLRNKEKAEVDFLITIKDRPVLSMECKLTDVAFDPSVLSFAKHIGLKHHVQLVASPNVWRRQTIEGIDVIIASAERILSDFV
jgi:predicted AAA+ superfamily ATPase